MHPEWQGEDVGTKGRMKVVRDASHAERVKAMRANYRVTYRTLWDHAGTTFERADGVRYATCHPTNATLAEWVGIDCRTVSRHLAALAEAGVIVVVGEGRARVICLFEDPDNLDKTAHEPRQIDTQTTTKRDTNLDNLDHEPRQKNHEPRQVAPPYKEEQTEQTLTRPNQTSSGGRDEDGVDVGAADFCNAYRAHRGVGSVIGSGPGGPLMATVDSLVASGEHTPRTARRFILDRLRVHDAWLREHHPKGADYGHDRFVKRLPALLTEGGYAEDPAMVHSHVKPQDSRPAWKREQEQETKSALERARARLARGAS